MSEVNIGVLRQQSDELIGLINETNNTMGVKSSDYVDSYKGAIDSLIHNPGAQAALVKNSKVLMDHPQTFLLGLGAIVVGFGFAKGADAISNARAKKKAKDALLGMYQELAAKLTLIIEEQKNLLLEMSEKQDKSEEEHARLQERYDTLETLVTRIKAFQAKAEQPAG